MTATPTIKRVYKYQLVIGEWARLYMPEGAEVLCVQVQDGQPFVWARVDIGAPPVMHNFRVVGTGHDLGSNVGRYIGTFQLDGGALVFHVFAESGT